MRQSAKIEERVVKFHPEALSPGAEKWHFNNETTK